MRRLSFSGLSVTTFIVTTVVGHRTADRRAIPHGDQLDEAAREGYARPIKLVEQVK